MTKLEKAVVKVKLDLKGLIKKKDLNPLISDELIIMAKTSLSDLDAKLTKENVEKIAAGLAAVNNICYPDKLKSINILLNKMMKII